MWEAVTLHYYRGILGDLERERESRDFRPSVDSETGLNKYILLLFSVVYSDREGSGEDECAEFDVLLPVCVCACICVLACTVRVGRLCVCLL